MKLRSRVFKVALASVLGIVAAAGLQGDSQADGEDPELCSSVPGECEYAPPTAPSLEETVCYQTGMAIILQPIGGCAAGYASYYVTNGEVLDPQTGEVAPYIRLKDACDMGYCLPYDPNTPSGEEGPMCCNPSTGTCSETDSICPPTTIAVWCPDGQTPQQGQPGEWECEEDS